MAKRKNQNSFSVLLYYLGCVLCIFGRVSAILATFTFAAFFFFFLLFRELPVVLGCFSGGENGPPLCLSAQPKCKYQKRKGNVIKVKTAIFLSVSFQGQFVEFPKIDLTRRIHRSCLALCWVIGLCGYTSESSVISCSVFEGANI